jgi:hypothetical protein
MFPFFLYIWVLQLLCHFHARTRLYVEKCVAATYIYGFYNFCVILALRRKMCRCDLGSAIFMLK